MQRGRGGKGTGKNFWNGESTPFQEGGTGDAHEVLGSQAVRIFSSEG